MLMTCGAVELVVGSAASLWENGVGVGRVLPLQAMERVNNTTKRMTKRCFFIISNFVCYFVPTILVAICRMIPKSIDKVCNGS